MPVAAKLSSRFYEKLGDDVANDLVTWLNTVDSEFRNELREENDLNWDRMRAEIDELGSRLTAEFRSGLTDLRMEMRTGFAGSRAALPDVVADLRTDIRQAYARQRRWMFFFWATTLMVLVWSEFL